jgi:hypothetical protein
LGSTSIITPSTQATPGLYGQQNQPLAGGASNNPVATSSSRNNNNHSRNRKGKDIGDLSRDTSKEQSPNQHEPGPYNCFDYHNHRFIVDPNKLASVLRGVIP